MKSKTIGFALVIAAFVSVTSGCYVGYGYEGRAGYRHHRHYDDRHYDDHRDHNDRDRY